MSGIQEYNFPAFFMAAGRLRAKGHIVFNPAENDLLLFGTDIKSNFDKADYRLVMEDDTRWICRYAEAMALHPGWEYSLGVKVEKALAECLGLEIMYLENNGEEKNIT